MNAQMEAFAARFKDALIAAGLAEPQAEHMRQLTLWFSRCGDVVIDGAAQHALQGDLNAQVAVIVKYNADSGDPHWAHFRSAHGAQDEYLAFLDEARTDVEFWDMDPNHLEHTPLDFSREVTS